MMKKNNYSKAIDAIKRHGALLAFPIKNNPKPHSLWRCLHPKTPMRWEWDDSGDSQVFELWRLREELSRSGQVVYGKFYKGRATFYSLKVFKNLLALLTVFEKRKKFKQGFESAILTVLEDSSPQSTKQIKKQCELAGRFHQKNYEQAMKNLWNELLICGWGEKDDGAFPSLQVGIVSSLFEDLYKEAQKISPHEAFEYLWGFKSELIQIHLAKVGEEVFEPE
jgi:hypothetical protein